MYQLTNVETWDRSYLCLFLTHAAVDIILNLRRAESYTHKLEANGRLKAPSVLTSLFT